MKLSIIAFSLGAATAYVPRGLGPSSRRATRIFAEEGSAAEAPRQAAGDDITNSKVFLEKKLMVLEDELRSLEVQLAEQAELKKANELEWGSQIEKLRIEFDNVRTRTSEERSHADATEKAHVLEQIFPAIDNLDRAFEFIKPKTDGEKVIFDQYEASLKSDLAAAFDVLGVKTIDEIGVKCDPFYHSVAFMQPDPEVPEEHVAQVLQKGYMFEKVVVRPATVVASSGDF